MGHPQPAGVRIVVDGADVGTSSSIPPVGQWIDHARDFTISTAGAHTIDIMGATPPSGVGYPLVDNVRLTSTTPVLGAEFVRQDVRPVMGLNQPAYMVSVTMRNTGLTSWPDGGGSTNSTIALRNLYPDGEKGVWWKWNSSITNRVSTGAIAPGQEATFVFGVETITTAGFHSFQARMDNAGALFGASTPLTSISVIDLGPLNGGVTSATASQIAGYLCFAYYSPETATARVYFKGTNPQSPDSADLLLGLASANVSGGASQCGNPQKGFAFMLPDVRPDGIWLKDGRSVWFVVRAEPQSGSMFELANGRFQLQMPDSRPDSATFISQDIPAAFGRFRVTFQNTGTNTWQPETHRLVPVSPGYGFSFFTQAAAGPGLASPVPPGQQVTFDWQPTINSTASGVFSSVWQMSRSGVVFGSATPLAYTTVRADGANGSNSQPTGSTPNSPLPYNQNPPSAPILVSPLGP
jgi:hypothetical protein